MNGIKTSKFYLTNKNDNEIDSIIIRNDSFQAAYQPFSSEDITSKIPEILFRFI